MKKGRTYYDVLGVATDAPTEIILAAYRAQMLAMKKHPDLGGDTDEAALINQAFEVLTDATKRAAYDETLIDEISKTSRGEAPKEDRRRAPRHESDAPVSFCIGHDNNWHTARVTDYSILGVRLRSHDQLKVGQHVVISPPNLASFALHGTVKWARAFHPNVFERVYEAGIEFSDQISDIDKRLAS